MKYYVYEMRRKGETHPFYVGSGTAEKEDTPGGRMYQFTRTDQPKFMDYIRFMGGKDNVESTVVKWCSTRKEAYDEEYRVTKQYIDEGIELVNVDIGTKHSLEHTENHRRALIAGGKLKGKNNGFYGKHHSDETIQYLRKHCGNPGQKNPRYGVHLSDEFKKAISESTKAAMHRPEVHDNLVNGIKRSRAMITLPINEIFLSISGEGPTAGLPTVFIRTYGCPLNCSYCDSRYACEGGEFIEMSVDDIVAKIQELAPGIRSVCVTGGECMVLPNIDKLLSRLSNLLYRTDIETCGAVDLSKFPKRNYIHYVVDYKTTSSGMKDRMVDGAFSCLGKSDTVKFVVGTQQDLAESAEAIKKYDLLNKKCNIYFSPVFGAIEPREIVEFMLANRLWSAKVQIQLHKVIYDPEERGV